MNLAAIPAIEEEGGYYRHCHPEEYPSPLEKDLPVPTTGFDIIKYLFSIKINKSLNRTL